MSRIRSLAIAFVCTIGFGSQACRAKPSEEACKDAINNVRRVTGQSSSDVGADPTGAIRSCRANSSKESVECVRLAKTLEDLLKCEGSIAEVGTTGDKTETEVKTDTETTTE